MHKVVASAEEAIQDVFDGATIMVGGFGLCGNPENLIRDPNPRIRQSFCPGPSYFFSKDCRPNGQNQREYTGDA